MDQISEYISLLEENKSFLDRVNIEMESHAYSTIETDLFLDFLKKETVVFTEESFNYTEKQEAKASLHRYLYLKAEEIFAGDEFADMSLEEKEVRKMRLCSKLEELYAYTHLTMTNASRETNGNLKESYKMAQKEMQSRLEEIMAAAPLDSDEKKALAVLDSSRDANAKAYKDIIEANRKMYYGYLEHLLSLKRIEIEIETENNYFYSKKDILLGRVKELKEENEECYQDIFNNMASMKKIIIGNKIKKYMPEWSTLILRAEAPVFKRHCNYLMNLESFRDMLCENPSTKLLLHNNDSFRILIKKGFSAKRRVLFEICAKAILGVLVSWILPCAFITFLVLNSNYIPILQKSAQIHSLDQALYLGPLCALMALSQFWNNWSVYKPLDESYSKKEKKAYLNWIFRFSIVEAVLAMFIIWNLIFKISLSTPNTLEKDLEIKALIEQKQEICMGIIHLLHNKLLFFEYVQIFIHVRNGFEVFKTCYWKHMAPLVYKPFLMLVFGFFIHSLFFSYCNVIIESLAASLDDRAGLQVSLDVLENSQASLISASA
ncbi:hypothetical protein NECID01_2119 [Nematocida sp. AWRm77]|nr:hypothetical protein NECID01_2119 [Nematocida sp. AWRm77]